MRKYLTDSYGIVRVLALCLLVWPAFVFAACPELPKLPDGASWSPEAQAFYKNYCYDAASSQSEAPPAPLYGQGSDAPISPSSGGVIFPPEDKKLY